MAIFKRSLAGPGYVILNVFRILNIICLLSVVTASAVMLVKTFVVSKFFFFDGVSHVVTACISVFLIVSELNIFCGYFNRNWPLIGQDAGFVTLGVTMILLGVSILGNLNKEATSQQSLGLAFWRIVIASGIIVIVVGTANIVLSYVFREKRAGVTARHVRTHGAVARDAVTRSSSSSHKSLYLGHKDSLPTYRSRSSSPRSTSVRLTPRLPLKISSPINENQEQFAKFSGSPEITMPNLAHHPAMYSDRV